MAFNDFYEDFGSDFCMDLRSIPGFTNMPNLHIHPHYEIMLVPKPVKQQTIINGLALPLIEEPSLTIHTPFSMHNSNFNQQALTERFVFYFGDTMIAHMSDAFRTFDQYKQALYTRLLLSPDLLRKLEPYLNSLRKNQTDKTLTKLNFLTVLHLVLLEGQMESFHCETKDPNRVTQIVKYMSAHCQESLTAEKICQSFHISRSKLNKDFSKYLSVSFHQLLIEMKISRAKEMLRYNKKDIKSIAQALGFEKDTYFYTFFKKATGLTPLQYRKQFEQIVVK